MKMTRHQGQLLVRQLSLIPGFTPKYPDRISQSEIPALQALLAKHPEINAAIRNQTHPAHAEVRWAVDRLRYFATEHPQDGEGEAAAWESGRLLDIDHPIADLAPDEAAARLEWARTQPEYLAARNPTHPDHAAYQRQEGMMLARATAEAEAPSAVADVSAIDPQPSRVSSIAELQRDPAYLDRTDPHHKAAVEAVTRAYQAAYPEAGAASAAASGLPAALTHSERIREIQKHPAYLDRTHPEHASKVSEMTAVYVEAHPEPATAPVAEP